MIKMSSQQSACTMARTWPGMQDSQDPQHRWACTCAACLAHLICSCREPTPSFVLRHPELLIMSVCQSTLQHMRICLPCSHCIAQQVCAGTLQTSGPYVKAIWPSE